VDLVRCVVDAVEPGARGGAKEMTAYCECVAVGPKVTGHDAGIGPFLL
jgi:hypothetical protein